MKTMCPPCYHCNGFVAIHAPGHMMYGLGTTMHHVPTCMSCMYECVLKVLRLHRNHEKLKFLNRNKRDVSERAISGGLIPTSFL